MDGIGEGRLVDGCQVFLFFIFIHLWGVLVVWFKNKAEEAANFRPILLLKYTFSKENKAEKRNFNDVF